jgi:hypothetical protein
MEQALLPRVKARVIIEMLGSPKAHLEKTLKDYVAKLRKDKSVEILKEEFSDSQERDGLFSMFAEIELWFKDIHHLLAFCFDAMPSSVEVLEPQDLHIDAGELQALLNDLQARLHTVDLALKEIKATLKIVDTNAVNVLHNFIVYALRNGEKTPDELGKLLGLPGLNTQAYLDKLMQDKRIKKVGTKYALN